MCIKKLTFTDVINGYLRQGWCCLPREASLGVLGAVFIPLLTLVKIMENQARRSHSKGWGSMWRF